MPEVADVLCIRLRRPTELTFRPCCHIAGPTLRRAERTGVVPVDLRHPGIHLGQGFALTERQRPPGRDMSVLVNSQHVVEVGRHFITLKLTFPRFSYRYIFWSN